ncbi:TPR-like protein [Suillus lakei]|nr:TPR-like protein [Suillus lakei]
MIFTPPVPTTLDSADVTDSSSWTSCLTLMRPSRSIGLHYSSATLDIPLRSESLHELAISLQDRFHQRSIVSDLDEAVELHRAALLLCHLGHPLRSESLHELAISLQDRFHQRSIVSDLDEAVELHRAALLLSFKTDSTSGALLSDLDEAVELHRAALLLHPPSHSDRLMSLDNIAINLDAIELHRAVLLLCPPGHSLRPGFLNNVVISLHDRFRQRGVPSDLDEVIELYRSSLLFRPPVILFDLGFSTIFQSNLDEAIELHRTALLLRPPDHSLRSTFLNNLVTSLHDRFKQSGIVSDLDEAIELNRAALLLCSAGHSL